MQQTYGLDIEEMDIGGAQTTRQVVRAASLCSQLPETSRLVRAIDPAAAWGVSNHIMRLIDYKLSILLWAMSGCKGEAPDPLEAPGDAEAAQIHAREIANEMASVAAAIPGVIQQQTK